MTPTRYDVGMMQQLIHGLQSKAAQYGILVDRIANSSRQRSMEQLIIREGQLVQLSGEVKGGLEMNSWKTHISPRGRYMGKSQIHSATKTGMRASHIIAESPSGAN
jgi:hypothetical protein